MGAVLGGGLEFVGEPVEFHHGEVDGAVEVVGAAAEGAVVLVCGCWEGYVGCG